MASCILYQSSKSTVFIVDIPRSIEQAQGEDTTLQTLLSSEPLRHPYPSVEPKSDKAKESLGQLSLHDLLLQKHVEIVLRELKADYHGDWFLPRISDGVDPDCQGVASAKRRKGASKSSEFREDSKISAGIPSTEASSTENITEKDSLFSNNGLTSISVNCGANKTAHIPPQSTFLLGEIATTRDVFIAAAPKFNLVVLDPPWPNRSARRKKSYGISYGTKEARELLSSLPVHDHLAEDGIVAIWITNKDVFRDMLLGDGGLFEEWGVGLVEEWIWLKVTASGEPICALDSMWRKPYEILLLGKRGASQEDVMRRVLIGVPDLHSRKPNLKKILEPLMMRGKYQALEIFARNLTEGWWAWGNEALKFQMEEHWRV